eukprot:365390-Chlamydomonas_euryale.AAC.25
MPGETHRMFFRDGRRQRRASASCRCDRDDSDPGLPGDATAEARSWRRGLRNLLDEGMDNALFK